MNSQRGSTSTFDFDLGIGSGRAKSLNDQRNQPSSYSSTAATVQSKPSWQPNKPSWTHQPAPSQGPRPGGLNGPTSMVGDITGKSWNSMGSGSGIGIPEKNPNLFGDLVGSSIGKGMGSSNVPLKNATPAPSTQSSNKSSFSMGNLGDSLPKTGNSVNSSSNRGANNSFGGNVNVNSNKTANLGGPSMRSMGGAGGGMSGNKDPFGSLVDFGSKQAAGGLNSGNKATKVNTGDDSFGNFQNASKPSATTFSNSGFSATSPDFLGSNTSSGSKGDFSMPNNDFASPTQPSMQSSSDDPLNVFFSSSSTSVRGAAAASEGVGGQPFSEVDDWGLDSDFGGSGSNDAGGSTMELEGLPPPPAGVTAASAKIKGIDNQKQGQYADAIKWLSWAVILCDKTGDETGAMEVLSCRASCYKEVGEYKKAVADCSKVLEQDNANVSVLVQRALLYESMEKYKLGAEDLRTVLKIDPGNRVARSTVHRLAKMAE
ncbi:hyphally regulated cell wall protein 1-like isoform X2 [Tripterygium wilfordii]|nr:hyphally regulated cell wall protein 1-like isoform X2 [Tripterygium wilfordii]